MDYYLDIMGTYSDSIFHELLLSDYDTLFCKDNSYAYPQVQTTLLPLYVGNITEMEEVLLHKNSRNKNFI